MPACFVVCLVMILCRQAQAAQEASAASALASVHGVVRNAATGEPLPRALVQIEGDAETGALTDGDGRFEIANVPVGQQAVEVRKPGFRDRAYAAGEEGMDQAISPPHNVLVAAEMPDLVFTLSPTGAIQGQVQLSSGDPAQGIIVELVRRTIEDGRAIWQAGGSTKTNRDGVYRFASLAEGVYDLYTDPAMENDEASTLVEPGHGSKVEREGYASAYYPDARDQSGAGRVSLRPGEQAQANLTLTLEPFYAITATAVPPASSSLSAKDRAGINYSALVMDTAGRQLPYHAQFDPESHTIQALLPNGNYSLLVSSVPVPFSIDGVGLNGSPSTIRENPAPMVGTAEFTVDGKAVANLTVPLTAPQPNPVQLTVPRSETAPVASQNGTMLVIVSLAGGWVDDGMVREYANGNALGPLRTVFTMPGAYWVHTHVARGFCEASFTAGGANLAREPVIIGLSGSTAPMDLTVRNDCAHLNLSLPKNLYAFDAGEEPYYTVYVVPDFDSTVDVEPRTLRPSTGGAVTMDDLTPGSYHVYTFNAPVRLEYRNPAALAALPNPGQSVTLSPGVTSDLVLEAPAQ